MRNFLLLCMAALCCLACNDSKIVTVTVTNPLAMDRSDEMVEVSMTEISNLLNLADTAQISLWQASRTWNPARPE